MASQDDNMKLIPKRQYITGGNEIFTVCSSRGCQRSAAERNGMGL